MNNRINLIRLNKECKECIENHPIVCFEKSISYLEELKLAFPDLASNIVGIVDDNVRNQSEFEFEGKRLLVSGTETLETINWDNTVLLIVSDYFYEAYDKLCEYRTIAEKVKSIYYFVNRETEYELEFREIYKNSELRNIILFRSGPHSSSYVKGMDFSDNARALFEYMLEQKMNEKYELVWMVKNPGEFDTYKKYPNVKFVSFDWPVSDKEEEREQYYRALCLAKFLFFTDAYGFARNCRSDQIRVQLWHGCGFKTRVNFVRCEKRYEYTTVISDLYAKIHAEIYGLRPEQVLITGYAKEDWLFHPITKDKLCSIGIPAAKKYVFWLPTFRSTDKKLEQLNEYCLDSQVGLPIIDTFEKLQEIDHVLQAMDMVLVVKLHPFQNAETVHCEGFEHIYLLENMQLVEQDIQINQLLGYADALISDYSSVAVDYLLLDRPIAFTLDDVDEYSNSRGFVFNDIKNWLPGTEIYDWMDFMQYIKDIEAGIDAEQEKRHRIKKVMHNFDDDRSCQRILDALGIEKE